jgi:peroxiredoxin
MAATPSTMLELGTPLPSFDLPDVVDGTTVSSESLRGAVAVVAIICNHCPFVVHMKDELARFGREVIASGVRMVAFSSNDVSTHPTDSPEHMAEDAERYQYPFRYLFDESQEVAKAFRAACTPEFYVFDAEGKLRYRGQFDDSRPSKPTPVTGADLRAAVNSLMAGKEPNRDQKPSVGCGIKWKPGNVPSYLR